jgi:HEAT repeat protein
VDAAAALMWIAENFRGEVAEDAISAAVLAEGVELWEELLVIARDRRRREGVREQALFWLSQEAGAKVVEELRSFVDDDDEDLEVREHAIFALSQRPADESVPALIRVATTNDHPELRKNALFWLAQHDDDRVVDLFEEILSN